MTKRKYSLAEVCVVAMLTAVVAVVLCNGVKAGTKETTQIYEDSESSDDVGDSIIEESSVEDEEILPEVIPEESEETVESEPEPVEDDSTEEDTPIIEESEEILLSPEEIPHDGDSDLGIKIYYTEQDVIDVAKVLYRECYGLPSMTEQACVAWTILNRVDNWDRTIYDVVREPNQFAYYSDTPVIEPMIELATDVLNRWSLEKNGIEDVGRVLPRDYMHFFGDGSHNYFRNAYTGNYDTWDYSLPSPYEN